ncbi:MAG TPA: hypothetical protein VES02_10395, partial [Dermatophilaceae bacterium]|nr:hypothetical protein [Dermatophilaceae bacterium]
GRLSQARSPSGSSDQFDARQGVVEELVERTEFEVKGPVAPQLLMRCTEGVGAQRPRHCGATRRTLTYRTLTGTDTIAQGTKVTSLVGLHRGASERPSEALDPLEGRTLEMKVRQAQARLGRGDRQ